MQRHTVVRMVDVSPYVQMLDAPVPQMVDNVMASFRLLDKPIADQVIEVPKISCPFSCPSRAFLFAPQVVEQFVEVPSVLTIRIFLVCSNHTQCGRTCACAVACMHPHNSISNVVVSLTIHGNRNRYFLIYVSLWKVIHIYMWAYTRIFIHIHIHIHIHMHMHIHIHIHINININIYLCVSLPLFLRAVAVAVAGCCGCCVLWMLWWRKRQTEPRHK